MAIDENNRVEVVLPDDTVIEANIEGALDAGDAIIGRVKITDGTEVANVNVSNQMEVEATTKGDTLTQTPTITAGAYSAGDNVGDLLTFANAALIAGGGGVIKQVEIIDDAGQDAKLELWLFDQTFTPGNDNDAWSAVEAELHNEVTIISTEDSTRGYLSAGTPSVCSIEVARRYDCIGTSLFGRLVTRGTPTFVATDDLTIKISLLQD